jgi:hypothetical protein
MRLLLQLAIVAAPVIAGRIVSRASLWRTFTSPLLAIPLLFAGAAVGGILSLFLPSVIAYGASGLLTLFFGYIVGTMPPRQSTRHYRGTVVDSDPHALAARQTRREYEGSLTVARIPVPPHDETKHFKFIGTTGTGKTTAIRELLQGALRRGDLVLNPFDSRSVKWDLFSEIRNPYDFEQLARSLIPDGAGEDRIFRHYAQTFLTTTLRQAHGSGVRRIAALARRDPRTTLRRVR